ncbi:Septum site-determining protein MinD [Aquimixticola soesokkakensis]|uniref:Septum site-determining protein MinD n=1 Tax=Aquimixticola soesokkakensis TaxID=1519096 RepID=A0A1Y5S4D1_9RHOB|nr:AAA family ATPase [Aquimixticola soesokkakensis]SLN32329.1 Septum site-determining protein MinD [Aquimixticola soesokkakensis]
MTSAANVENPVTEVEAPLVACTISRDVQNFDLLIEDMETELGEGWGDLSFDDARQFFKQDEARDLEFVAVAIDGEDVDRLAQIADVIKSARDAEIKVIVIAEEVSPSALHQLLQLGAEEFIPYPLPEEALAGAIARLRTPAPSAAPAPQAAPVDVPGGRLEGKSNGIILPVQGLAGGTGASTLAVNLAYELATVEKKGPQPRVLLIDLSLQHGAVATYLDLPRREAVYELLSSTDVMDNDSFLQALLNFNDKMSVLTAPAELMPLDVIEPEDVQRLLDIARRNFDYVVVDMPTTIVSWTEIVLTEAEVFLSTLELDMRSAQNCLRFLRALKAEELPIEKLRYVLNRAPRGMDITAKSRIKRLAESLDIDIELQLPDGGKQVAQSGDHGLPLSESAAKNPLRKEIMKLAQALHLRTRDAKAIAA